MREEKFVDLQFESLKSLFMNFLIQDSCFLLLCIKVSQKPKLNKELEALQKKKISCYKDIIDEEELEANVKKIDSEIASTLLSQQRINFEKELNELKELKVKKGKSAAIFNLKSTIVGPKKSRSGSNYPN
jgi:hypothetical protein